MRLGVIKYNTRLQWMVKIACTCFSIFDLDLWVKVRQNIAQNPVHHATYAPAKFEVAKSNSLRGTAIPSKYII